MKVDETELKFALEWLRSDEAKRWRDHLCRTDPLLAWRVKRSYYRTGTLAPDVCEDIARSLERFGAP